GRTLATSELLHQRADSQVGLADTHVVGQGEAAQADVRTVAGKPADQDDDLRQGRLDPFHNRGRELFVTGVDGQSPHLGPGGRQPGQYFLDLRLEVGGDLSVRPQVVVLGLPGIGGQFAAAGQANLASFVKQPADVKAVVQQDVEVAGLVLYLNLFQSIVDVTQAVWHQAQVAGRAVDYDDVHSRPEVDLGQINGIDGTPRPGNPGPRR